MRKSLNLVIGVFLFVLVFSFFGFKSDAGLLTDSGSTTVPTEQYSNAMTFEFDEIDLVPAVDPDSVYAVELSISHVFTFAKDVYVRNYFLKYGDSTIFALNYPSNTTSAYNVQQFDFNGTVYLKGSQLSNQKFYAAMRFMLPSSNASSDRIAYTSQLNYQVVNVIELDGDALEQYESGYNDGYSTGLVEGESQGFNAGYQDGYSDGEDAGYESGFIAGQGSVNTDNYYNSGYNDGRNAGYSAGYTNGYETGYQDAMDKIVSDGDEVNIYPILKGTYSSSSKATYRYLKYNEMENISFNVSNVNMSVSSGIDPSHIYCLDSTSTTAAVTPSSYARYSYYEVVLETSGSEYIIYSNTTSSQAIINYHIFIPGNILSNNVILKIKVYDAYCSNESSTSTTIYLTGNLAFELYDYGPISNTDSNIQQSTTQITDTLNNQTTEINNTIESQTDNIVSSMNDINDNITHGFDDTAAGSASSTFADNAASYEEAESNIFTSAKSDLDNFQFYDFSSDSTVLVGLSFVASTMTAIFGAMGGLFGGAGIVLSVLFSVMLVSIVIGTYRYFVSSGKTGSSGSKKGGKG